MLRPVMPLTNIGELHSDPASPHHTLQLHLPPQLTAIFANHRRPNSSVLVWETSTCSVPSFSMSTVKSGESSVGLFLSCAQTARCVGFMKSASIASRERPREVER